MTALRATVRRLGDDQRGQTTVEWALVLATFGVPLFLLFEYLLRLFADYYGMMTFLLELPL